MRMKCCHWVLVRDNCQEEPISLMTRDLVYAFWTSKTRVSPNKKDICRKRIGRKSVVNTRWLSGNNKSLAIVIYLVILKADLVKAVPNLVCVDKAMVVYSTLQILYTAPMHSWVVPKLSFIEPKPLCITEFDSLLCDSGGIQYLTKVIYSTNALLCTSKAIL